MGDTATRREQEVLRPETTHPIPDPQDGEIDVTTAAGFAEQEKVSVPATFHTCVLCASGSRIVFVSALCLSLSVRKQSDGSMQAVQTDGVLPADSDSRLIK